MRFSRGRTYNSHDTTVSGGDDGRWEVDQTRGVRIRCELSLNALLRFGAKGATDEMVTNHLNKRLKANYTNTDIGYALNRLANESVIRAEKYGRGNATVYRATKSAQEHWRKLPKDH